MTSPTRATAAEAPPRGLPPAAAWLLSVACGLAVANVYYSQPLLDLIAADYGIDPATIGLVGTLTQTGYALGLLLLVPLGDRVNRRTLTTAQLGLSVLALAAVALAPSAPLMLAAMAAVGVLAVVAQVVVAYAASLAAPADRGRVVGTVTSGIVVGILLARTVAGTIGDLAGWRAVYVVSAVATGAMALAVAVVLPAERHRPSAPTGQTARTARISYPRLIGSVFTLFAEEPVLRARAVLALLTFTSITVLLTPMVLPLAAPPFSLSHTQIGLFGLAGAAGALGAGRAGRQADRGRAEHTAGIGLLAMLAAWIPAALLPRSVWWLVLAMVVIDYGLQSVHVVNQHLLYQVRPEAQSRLTAGYMLLYSAGCAAGAIGSTVVYEHWGWTAVCLLGAATSLAALLYWLARKQN
ncbi:MFS transporter [Kitasatospora sp. NPDC059811]|uniref:MFS transporter n=1 Tax=Streptomycetaceae TaxID=2062 RepID=UPI0007AF5F3D|nr:MFS transporter [Streptomyces sp. MJM8645]